MSIWYRVAQDQRVEAVFSGDGGLYVAGRWHNKGTKAIYCSESIALCTLEWLSHNGLSVSGFSYAKFSIEVPDEQIIHFSKDELPKSWKDTPSPKINSDFMEEHFFNPQQYLAMAVSSVIIPEESNLVINPLHPEFIHARQSIKLVGEFTAPHR